MQEAVPAFWNLGTSALLEKYAPSHLVEGKAYMRQAKSKTCVLRFTVEHLTAKARR